MLASKTNARAGAAAWLSRSPRPGRILLAVVAPLVFLIAAFTPFAQRIENQYGLGLLYALRGAVAPPPGAIVVALDRQSIDWLRTIGADRSEVPPNLAACLPSGALDELARLRGPSDLPRALHACLLRTLREMDVPVVVLDILFAVPSDPAQDDLLADALRTHGATVLLGRLRAFHRRGAGRGALGGSRNPPLFPL